MAAAMDACLLALLNPEWVTAVFTGVLTLATIIYVLVTGLLWRETRKSTIAATVAAEAARSTAEATKIAADAAKLSADMAAELNRPMLGVADMKFVIAAGMPSNIPVPLIEKKDIHVVLRNYGNLYTKKVALGWKAYMDTLASTRNDRSNMGPFEIAPGADCPINLAVLISGDDCKRIGDGTGTYKVKIQAEYSTPDERHRFRYTAVRVLNSTRTFTMDPDEPDQTETLC